ncbi:FHA domain-containing protein [Corallincola spongiicola]|uniref:FHA domain-containing protein n=1 Tax=Corallincola spongiicola TaxID=2520508 RepID=A0ABY1WPJ8_9GAMM|nr:FHA domain-containing protein [Corallincola spongiicola]TAA45882.1 FHA domain-containing protein [Corallincola spongiicola]
MMKRLLTAMFISLLSTAAWSADIPHQGLLDSSLKLKVYLHDEPRAEATAVVLATGYVVTSSDALEKGQRFAVVDSSGAELAAVRVNQDDKLALTLLKVEGLNAPALVVARQQSEQGRAVGALSLSSDKREQPTSFHFGIGSITELVSDKDSGQRYISHNVKLTDYSHGGALVNNCGELIGINVPDPDASIFTSKEGIGFSVPLAQVQAMSKAYATTTVAKEICLSAAEQARLAAEALADTESKLAETEKSLGAELDALETERNDLQKQREAEAKKAAEAKKLLAQLEEKQKQLKDATAEEKAALGAEIDAQKAVVAETAERAAQLEVQLTEQQAALDAAIAKQAEQQLWLIYGGIVAGVIVLALIIMLQLRKRKSNQLVQQQQMTAEELQQAQQNLAAKAAHEQALASVPDLLLVGLEGEAASFAVRIQGSSLGAAVDGLVIGRSPNSSELVVTHSEVSRQHARLIWVSQQLMLEDLASTNGVCVNGVPLTAHQPHMVHVGDRVQLGTLVFELRKA